MAGKTAQSGHAQRMSPSLLSPSTHHTTKRILGKRTIKRSAVMRVYAIVIVGSANAFQVSPGKPASTALVWASITNALGMVAAFPCKF